MPRWEEIFLSANQNKQRKEKKKTRASFVRVQKVFVDRFRVCGKGQVRIGKSRAVGAEICFRTNKKSGGDDNIVEDDLTIELKTKASLQKSLKELERILLPNARLEMVTQKQQTRAEHSSSSSMKKKKACEYIQYERDARTYRGT